MQPWPVHTLGLGAIVQKGSFKLTGVKWSKCSLIPGSFSWNGGEMSLVQGKSKWLYVYTHSELQHSEVCKVKEKELVEEFLATTIEEVCTTHSNR